MDDYNSVIGCSFSAWELFHTAVDASRRAKDTSRRMRHRDSIVAVCFAVSSLECYLAEVIWEARSRQKWGDSLADFANIMEQLIDDRVQTKVQWNFARKLLSGSTFDKASIPYQDFSLLVDTRNQLIHLKPETTHTKRDDAGNVEFTSSAQRIIRSLVAKHFLPKELLTSEDPLHSRGHWCCWLDAEIALWACNTAVLMVDSLWNEIPDKQLREYCALHFSTRWRTDLEI